MPALDLDLEERRCALVAKLASKSTSESGVHVADQCRLRRTWPTPQTLRYETYTDIDRALDLKCDEDRPACQRCTKSGVECAGYPELDVDGRLKPKSRFIIYTATPGGSPRTPPDMDQRQRRSLDFFCKSTAPGLADPFPSQLWYEIAQLAMDSQNPIREAVLAVADIHEVYMRNYLDRRPQVEYPMTQYKKAIHQVCRLDESKEEHALDFALAACVIFSCIEGLRGHYQSLLSNLRSGMRIMMQMETNTASSRISYLSREMLRRLFIGVNTQLMAYGDECLFTGASIPPLVKLPDVFESACQAMSALERFYCELMQFYLSLEAAAVDPVMWTQQGPSLLSQHEGYKHYFHQWTLSCKDIFWHKSQTSIAVLRGLSSEALIVFIMSVSVSIALEVDITNADMDMDRFEPKFREILMACEEFLRKQSVYPRHMPLELKVQMSPTFSMRLGIIPHLYWVASRCRDPMIRRWALRLLISCNRREGLWDSTTCSHIAKRVISIEETAAISSKNQLESDGRRTLTSASDILRSARVTVRWAKFEAQNSIKICYANLQDRSETVEVLEL